MKQLYQAIPLAALMLGTAHARGVTPYMPLHLEPEIERQVERVLILGGKSVLRRPIPAAVVLDALPAACKLDPMACEQVRRYLGGYIEPFGITSLRVQAALTSGDSVAVLPNAHGESVDSPWRLSGSAHWQPSDYLIVNLGAVGHDDNVTATGSYVSFGFDFAQVDIGFRDHWLSPLSESSFLIGTQAPTLISATLSNYAPITKLGFNYEVFLGELSRQENIPFQGAITAGRPRLSGLQLGVEPVPGYGLSVNRLVQYGGGARNGNLVSQFFEETFQASNRHDAFATEEVNRIASIAASMAVPAAIPFVVRLEYAGEDSSYAGNYRLGDTGLSFGIDIPLVADRFDISFETSEWQNAWYVHSLYPEGLTNKGHVLGHWFGDQRQAGDKVGGWSALAQAGYRSGGGDYWRARYRVLDFVTSENFQTVPEFPYRTLHEVALQYSTSWHGFPVNAELSVGRDALGESFARLMASIDFAMTRSIRMSETQAPVTADGVELYADIGVTNARVNEILAVDSASWTGRGTGYHLGAGVYRGVSTRSDLGVGLELDAVDDNLLLSLRALDYRHRFTPRLAANVFLGVGRYDWEGSPAHGWYTGMGVSWRDVLPGWDAGLDVRSYDKLSRNRVMLSDPAGTPERPRIHFDVQGFTLYLRRRIG